MANFYKDIILPCHPEARLYAQTNNVTNSTILSPQGSIKSLKLETQGSTLTSQDSLPSLPSDTLARHGSSLPLRSYDSVDIPVPEVPQYSNFPRSPEERMISEFVGPLSGTRPASPMPKSPKQSQNATPESTPPRSRQGSITEDSVNAPNQMPQREVAIPEVVSETVPEPVAASSSAIAAIVDSVAPVVPAESAPRIPEFAGGFNVNFSFLSENIIKEGAPDYNGGNRGNSGGSGWGSGPFGNGDEENYFPEIPNLLLYSFIYQLFMDRAIISFNKAVSQLEYSLADKCLAVLRKSNPNSLKYRVFKFILGILSCLVAPKVLEFTIKNTANTTSRMIRRVSFPLFRLFLHVLVFAGASVLAIKAISYVVYNMDPTIEKLCSLAWGDYTNPVVLFLELCLKCVIASILTDVVVECFKNFIKISQVLKDPLLRRSLVNNEKTPLS